MNAKSSLTSALVAFALLTGCGDDDTGGVSDSGTLDTGSDVMTDTGEVDTGPVDPTWFNEVGADIGVDIEFVNTYDTLTRRMLAGVCVIDVDGEAPLDLFYALGDKTGDNLSRLYVGQGEMRFADETSERMGELPIAGGCLAFDIDGDRDDDLILTGLGLVTAYINDGGTFTRRDDLFDVEVDEFDMMTSAAAGDLDGDEDLDLVVSGFMNRREALTVGGTCGFVPCAVEIAPETEIRNYVFAWNGARYEDVTETLVPGMMTPAATHTVMITDIGDDGIQNIWQGNDFGHITFNAVYGYRDGVYEDFSELHGMIFNRLESGQDTMGFTQGDVNNDGIMDFASTDFERRASGIYVCDEDLHCADASRNIGTEELADSFRWGNAFVDLDLDGWVDLVEATGQIYSILETNALGFSSLALQRPNIMRNHRGTFEPADPVEGEAHGEVYATRGISVTDLDDDGLPDVLFAPVFGRAPVFHNIRATDGHYLRVVLEGRAPNTGAVGAKVTLRGETQTLIRRRLAGEGYLGNFDPRIFFGTVDEGPYEVIVKWPDGTTTTRSDVPADSEAVFRQE